jgi:hypothetical protein
LRTSTASISGGGGGWQRKRHGSGLRRRLHTEGGSVGENMLQKSGRGRRCLTTSSWPLSDNRIQHSWEHCTRELGGIKLLDDSIRCRSLSADVRGQTESSIHNRTPVLMQRAKVRCHLPHPTQRKQGATAACPTTHSQLLLRNQSLGQAPGREAREAPRLPLTEAAGSGARLLARAFSRRILLFKRISSALSSAAIVLDLLWPMLLWLLRWTRNVKL